MKTYNISSSELTAKISSNGAELFDLRLRRLDHNWIWGASEPWKRHAPLLFPFVGKLNDDQYRYNGVVYKIKQHGFARDHIFVLDRHTSSSVSFSLEENDDTLKMFPFRFLLNVEYRVVANMLSLKVDLENRGVSDLFFNFGWHPGFVLPRQYDSEKFIVKTNGPVGIKRTLVDGLVSCDFEEYFENTLVLNSKSFDSDAFVFPEKSWSEIGIFDCDNSYVKFRCDDVENFGLWSKSISHFICLEPWWGLPDIQNQIGHNIEKKMNILKLGPNSRWEKSVSIEVGTDLKNK